MRILKSIRSLASIIPSSHHNRDIRYDLSLPNQGNNFPLAVFVHGFKGFKEWGPFPLVAQIFAASGIAFLKFDMSHNGTTAEQPQDFADLDAFADNSLLKELNDLQDLIDHIHADGWDKKYDIDLSRLHLIGHSRGGGIALLKSSEESRIRSVSSWAGVTDYAAMWDEKTLAHWKKEGIIHLPNARTGQLMPVKYSSVEEFDEHRDRLTVLERAKHIKGRIAIFHGTADPTVPVEMAHRLKKVRPDAELEVLDGADHTFGVGHPFEADRLSDQMEFVVKKTIDFIKRD
ncbi:MAG: alpha/beta fold hydrolase [Cyclobacteriaceae bacterium]|nr:alpha/beta fold hydrolase [Cyclobacteriaceae bacterium]MCH8515417.1 alpha/beta fold hydrolase [Cyclobacteriaceae bacterium]